MSDLEESKEKSIDAVTRIIDTLEGLNLNFGEAMSALSAALVISALRMGASKDEVMINTGLQWDSIVKAYGKGEAEEQPTH